MHRKETPSMATVHPFPAQPPEQVPPAGADPAALAEVAAKQIAAMDIATKEMTKEAKTTGQWRREQTTEMQAIALRLGDVEGAIRAFRWALVVMGALVVLDVAVTLWR